MKRQLFFACYFDIFDKLLNDIFKLFILQTESFSTTIGNFRHLFSNLFD